ncbi:MAG TPA: hypothetical protein VLT32_16970 [Candidatus Sulfomarinibacteraceae bacterium]|nr:hypothetical protein [Candidatus Sulfomarinibacteraceae bacterium]
MDRDIRYRRGDSRLFRAIRAVWGLAQALARPSFPPGVYRFSSIDQAAAQRTVWERRNIERIRREHHPG